MGEHPDALEVLRNRIVREGKCTKCGAVAGDGWIGCPLDGFCMAPNYAERSTRARLAAKDPT